MARRVFFSFHYKPDSWRASQVRNMGVIEGNPPVKDNDWETITKGGEAAIKKWINDQLLGRSCTVVLIGAETSGRKWINYEIEKTWNDGKGLVGVYIHNLKDFSSNQTSQGGNPFGTFKMSKDGTSLANIVKTYNPPYYTSTDVYNYIKSNIDAWVEEAVRIRGNY